VASKPQFRIPRNELQILFLLNMSTSTTNCALGADGELLDASEICWYNDADDDKPMSAVPTQTTRPRREAIPTARLTDANAEKPLLKSHQAAIKADQLRKATAPSLPTLFISREKRKNTTKGDGDDSAFASGGGSELIGPPKKKQMTPSSMSRTCIVSHSCTAFI
jgi:hypothetical protein